MAGKTAIPALPDSLSEQAHFDVVTGVLSVDQRARHNPVLVSWLSARRVDGQKVTVVSVDPSELGRLRAGQRAPEFATAIDDAFRRRARDMIVRAAAHGSSDIHLQVRETDAVIFFAVSGRLRVAERLAPAEGKRFARTWYQGIAEVSDTSYLETEFQNAQIPGNVFPPDSGIEAVRIVRGPCYPQHYGAEFMTLRVQYKGGFHRPAAKEVLHFPERPKGKLQLAEMGFTDSQLEKINYLLACPTGLVLFVGPTGSGKTTSIYQFLAETLRQRPYLRVVTAEDPPEIPIDGAVQLAVVNARDQESTAEAYGLAARTMLRMAPNVILIGELRDGGVAETALEAGMTGHKVVSTLHVDDAFQFVDRLELMGRGSATLNRRILCDPRKVRGVVAQRLLAHVCDQCAVPLKKAQIDADHPPVSERIVRALSTWGPLDRVRVTGPGCPACSHTGLKGRYAVAEVVVTDAELMLDYVHESTAVARDRYHERPDSDPPLLHAAIARCLAGQVDPTEIELIDTIPERRSRSTAAKSSERVTG